MNTSFSTFIVGRASIHARRACCTSSRSCSLACRVFFEGKIPFVQLMPQRAGLDRNALCGQSLAQFGLLFHPDGILARLRSQRNKNTTQPLFNSKSNVDGCKNQHGFTPRHENSDSNSSQSILFLGRAQGNSRYSKYPPAEPVALRLLAPQRGLTATVEKQKQEQKQRPAHFTACNGIDRSRAKDRLP